MAEEKRGREAKESKQERRMPARKEAEAKKARKAVKAKEATPQAKPATKEKERKEAKDKKPADREAQLKAHQILKFPLITEKAVNMIEAENKLVFITRQNATKQDIKKAVESIFGVEVDKINIIRDMKARKKAVVKINKKYKAEDITTKLGVL